MTNDDIVMRICLEQGYHLLADISEQDAIESFNQADQSLYGDSDKAEVSDETGDSWLSHMLDVEAEMKKDWPCVGGPLRLDIFNCLDNPLSALEYCEPLRSLEAFCDRIIFREIRGKLLKVTLISYRDKHQNLTRQDLASAHESYDRIIKSRSKQPLARGFCRFEIIVISKSSNIKSDAQWIQQHAAFGHTFSSIRVSAATLSLPRKIISSVNLPWRKRRYYQYLLTHTNETFIEISERLEKYPIDYNAIYWGALTSCTLTAISLFIIALFVPTVLAVLLVLFGILPGAYIATTRAILPIRTFDQAKIFYISHSLLIGICFVKTSWPISTIEIKSFFMYYVLTFLMTFVMAIQADDR